VSGRTGALLIAVVGAKLSEGGWVGGWVGPAVFGVWVRVCFLLQEAYRVHLRCCLPCMQASTLRMS
jgi:hypothetical protein